MTSKKNKNPLHNPFKDRTPVKRFRAGQNILVTLLSFAFSVSATRLFLEITGYPQLGSGNIHIAHVLWGGLFLFAAALIPIIYVNEWALTLSSLLAGLGVGLFIDEVGKFITSNNDYFYPSAAPIVYVLFLLTAYVSVQVRLKNNRSTRSRMYEILERFSEVLDRDLSSYEREKIMQTLAEIRQGREDRELSELASALQSYLNSKDRKAESLRPNFLDRVRISWLRFERKKLTRPRLRWIIIIGLIAWGVWALISPVLFFSISRNPSELQRFLNELMANHLVGNASGLSWFEARVIMEGGMGLTAILAAVLVLFKAEKTGTWIGLIGLIVALTVVNLLVFYFDQFSTILIATLQFILLVFIASFRRRFLEFG